MHPDKSSKDKIRVILTHLFAYNVHTGATSLGAEKETSIVYLQLNISISFTIQNATT